MPAVPPIGRALLKGSFWMVFMRWCISGLGLLSTVILARILTPEDFGVVAMAMVVVGLIEVIFTFGVDLALIQNTAATKDHFNTAWTIRVAQALAVALLIAAFAPFGHLVFGDPRVELVLLVTAAGVAIRGFENIGTVAFRRDLQFHREFSYLVTQKLLTVGATLVLAFTLRTYWALVLGIVFGQVIQVGLSYAMHPYRPRPCIKNLQEIFSFSAWMAVSSIGNYLYEQGDRLLAGIFVPTRQLGLYSMASELAFMPASLLILPMTRSLFPGFAKLKDEPDRLNTAFVNVFGAVATVSLPVGLGLAAVGPECTGLVLGAQWDAAIPFLQILAVFTVFRMIYGLAGNLCIAVGRIKVFAILNIFSGILAPLAMWAGFAWLGLVGIAAAKALLGIIKCVIILVITIDVTKLSPRKIVSQLIRPSVSSAVMLAAIFLTAPVVGEQALAVALVFKIAIGVCAYSATLLALWFLAGRPDGLERMATQMLMHRQSQ